MCGDTYDILQHYTVSRTYKNDAHVYGVIENGRPVVCGGLWRRVITIIIIIILYSIYWQQQSKECDLI